MDNGNLERIFHALQQFQKVNLFSSVVCGMTHSEFMIMRYIRLNSMDEGVKITTIAEKMEISKPAVSQMINVLEEKGYVERVTTKADRRIVYVKLSQLGNELLNATFEKCCTAATEMIEKMGEEDVRTLIRLINKLYLIAQEYKAGSL